MADAGRAGDVVAVVVAEVGDVGAGPFVAVGVLLDAVVVGGSGVVGLGSLFPSFVSTAVPERPSPL